MRLKNLFGFALVTSVFITSCSKTSTDSNSTTGNWIKRSEFEGVARAEAVSFVVNDIAFVATGYDGTKRLKDLWQYDATSDFWTQKADLPGVARSSGVAFATTTKGYVGTGYDGTDKLKDFWEYDPATNSWAQKADFAGSARYDAVAFAIADNGYISTGFDGNYLKDMWRYNPATNTWSQEVSMGGSKRSQAVAFVYNNKAYITTGSNNGTTVNDLWEYDPSKSASGTPWTEKRKISNVSDDSYDDAYNIVRNNAVAFVAGDKAYISTGNNSSYLKTTWEYDFANDVWTVRSPFEGTERDGAVAFTAKTRGYIVTGKNSTYYFDDIFQFRPDETLDTND